RTVLHAIQHGQRGQDLAAREGADLELAASGLGYIFGDVLAAGINGVGTTGEAGGETPLKRGCILGEDRSGEGSATSGRTKCGLLEEGTTLHEREPLFWVGKPESVPLCKRTRATA